LTGKTDRSVRQLRVEARATEVFEHAELARTWLREPNPALGNRVPAELLATEKGARAVETVLRRIEHGD
jgi:putative toxin-antitoxin system antitoxin component (TIGR02293 family)